MAVAGAGALLASFSGHAVPARADTAPAPAPEPGVCQGCKPPLTYHGGPVLGPSTVTLTPIYWAPSGYSFPASYTTIVNQYLTDVAAASGKMDNIYAVDGEYYQMTGGTKANAVYNIRAGTPVNATDPFPATTDPCTVNPPYTACITDVQLKAELATVLAANNLPADLGHMYLLMFPPNAQTLEGKARSLEVYCGIHGAFDLAGGGGTVVYADEPYLSPITGCSGGQAPNADPAADAEVSILAHEIVEAITDPVSTSPSWFDTASPGNEIGDECNMNFGPPAGSTDPSNPQTTQYNQVINGHNYYTQTTFSNAAYAANGVGKGCVVSAFTGIAPAAVTLTSDRPASATVDASETKLAADGTSTAKVTITIVDSGGEPVGGDEVHFDVRASDATPGDCGTVSPVDGKTDENGEVVTTYTASKQDVACIVFGLEAEAGTSDWATLYQGSAQGIEPGITDASLPAAITPGAAATTFSVTATNPSSTDIADARFDLFITGDNNGANGTVGLTSSQVHVQYSDDSTGGKFVDVPTSGETIKDGEIAAYVMPDTAADLAANGSNTVTFRISIDAGAPTTAASGTPLHIETDLDQFNPADGSQNNLDYVGPADLTVTAAGSSSPSSSSGLPLVVIILIVVGGVGVIAAGIVLVTRRRRPAAS